MLNKKCLLILSCCFVLQASALAIDVPMNIVPQAGTMNAHDLQNIEQRRIEYQVEKDYKNFEKNKKEKQQEQEKIKNKNIEVEKATAEEYATKGVYISKIIVSPSEILTSTFIFNSVGSDFKILIRSIFDWIYTNTVHYTIIDLYFASSDSKISKMNNFLR